MRNVDRITIESDEHGFELHLTDDEGETHAFNVDRVAEDLYRAVRAEIGPWLAERDAARRSMPPEDDEPISPHESPMDYYQRTGDADPLLDGADRARKALREGG